MRLDIFSIDMPQLGQSGRKVRVLLPPGYADEPERRYPVLYMQDGHNLFDPGTATFGAHWRIGESLDELAATGDTRRMIVVGVDCDHGREGLARLDEYSPWVNPRIALDLSRAAGVAAAGGKGEAYLSFLLESLMPEIDRRYRTLRGPESTGIAGSSMGGLFSLWALYRAPKAFGLCGAFSSAFWFAKAEALAALRAQWRPGASVYLDVGTAETSDDTKPDFARRYLQDTLDMRDELMKLGQPEAELLCAVDEGAEHSERAWARRFPRFADWAMDRLEGSLDGRR